MTLSSPKRLAVLVGDPNSKYGYLPGVSRDIETVARFFSSDHGGALDANEIRRLAKPSKQQLDSVLCEPADIMFFFFAGHGAHSGTRQQNLLTINDYEDVAIEDLWLNAKRQIMVIDACRTLLVEAGVAEFADKVAYAMAEKNIYTRYENRKLYNSSFMEAEEGRSVMYSCSVNQEAAETATGEKFTTSLLSWAYTWTSQQSQGQSKVLDVPTAFQLARASLANLPQTPILENGRRRKSFPFAVVA
jgi:hypothetical protein